MNSSSCGVRGERCSELELEPSVMVLSSPEHRPAPTPTPGMGGNLSKFDFYVMTTAEEPSMFNIVSGCDKLEDDGGSSR